MRGGNQRSCAVFSLLIAVAACDSDRATGPHDALLARAAASTFGLGASAVSASRIELSWQENSNNERGFEIHRSTTGVEGTFAPLATVAANVTNHADESLGPKTEYCYKVRSFRTAGPKTTHAEFSNTACATTFGPPATPSGVTARPFSSSDVDIGWNDVSNDESGFRVERAAAATGPWTLVVSTAAGRTTHRDAGRTAEQVVCYRVIAFNVHGGSAPSSAACTAPPAQPTNLVAAAEGQNVDIAWTDASAVEDGYELQRARDDFVWSRIALVPASQTTYRDIGLVSDTRYWYRVRATRDGGFSSVSNRDDAIIVGIPATPTAVDARPVTSAVILVGWASSSPSVQTFRIERSLDGGVTWTLAATQAREGFDFYDLQRTPEQEACYRVFAINALGGESAASLVDCTVPPNPPMALRATLAAGGGVDLAWSDMSPSNTGYTIEALFTSNGCQGYYYCYYPYPYSAWAPIAFVGGDATAYHDPIHFFGQSLTYRVLATRDGGTSDPSNEATATAPPE